MTEDDTKRPVTAKTIAMAVAIGLIGAVLLFWVGVWAMQGRLIYGADGGAHAAAAPGWSEIKVDVPGQGQVSTYVKPARPGKFIVLFMHGGGYAYPDAIKATLGFSDSGMGVVIPEYPGRGGNPGKLDEASAKATAIATLAKLVASGVKPDDIILYGEDFGAGAAIAAAQKPHRRLLIVSGISDMQEVVTNVYPMIPGFLISDRWDVSPMLKTVKGKVTILHAADDAKVPISQADAMAKAARTNVIVVTGGHRVVFDHKLQDTLSASMSR